LCTTPSKDLEVDYKYKLHSNSENKAFSQPALIASPRWTKQLKDHFLSIIERRFRSLVVPFAPHAIR
jgi:hypothetical protein